MGNIIKRTVSVLTAVFTAAIGTVSSFSALAAHASTGNQAADYVYDGYSVAYRIADSWGITDRVTVTLSNTGSDTLENWMLYFNPNGEAYGFNGIREDYTATEIRFFRNAGYNDSLAPGESATFEYLVNDCEAVPEQFALCQTRAEKTGGFDASLISYSAWGSQFNGMISLHNQTSQPISAWELTFDTNFTITAIPNSWAADCTPLGDGQYRMKGVYNDVIEPNGTVTIGFIGEVNGTPELGEYSLTEVIPDEHYLNELVLGHHYSISDLRDMNADSAYPLEITQNDDGTVSMIDGKFSEVLVTDEHSARDALSGIRELLGICDLSADLVLDSVYEDHEGDFKSYFFSQVYHGIPVYGKSVTVVAGRGGNTLSVDSNYTPVSGLSLTPVYSAEAAAAQFGAQDVSLCVYADGQVPVLAYRMNAGAECIIASADDLSVLDQFALHNALNGTNSPYDDDFTNPDGSYFHRNAAACTATLTGEADALALVLSQNLAVDFSGAAPLNTLSAANLQETVYQIGFHFDQLYNSVPVFGREVLVAAVKHNGKLYTFESNVVPIPDGFSTIPSAALEARRNTVNGTARLVIYTWDANEQDAAPRLAYIVTDEAAKQTHIVFEDEVWDRDLGKGLDEGGYENIGTHEAQAFQARPMRLHYFPVTKVNEASSNSAYKLSVLKSDIGIDDEENLKIEMRQCQPNPLADPVITTETVDTDPASADRTYFYAPGAVSAYLNLIRVSKWYANESGLNRKTYSVYDHDDLNIEKGDIVCGVDAVYNHDNAYSNKNYAFICAKYTGAYTMGCDISVITHEFTHGVFGSFGTPEIYNEVAGGINEGYADTFSAFLTKEWAPGGAARGPVTVEGEADRYRNAANELNYYHNLDNPYIGDKYQLIPYVIRPAYILEHQGEISGQRLYNLYYNSMAMGRYAGGFSNLNSFRSHIMRAAKAKNYTPEELSAVSAAFERAWGTVSERYNLTVHAVDYSTNTPIPAADITVKLGDYGCSQASAVSLASLGGAIKPGYYDMIVTAPGYKGFRQNFYMGYNATEVAVSLVSETTGTGEITVCAHDFVNSLPVDCEVELTAIGADGRHVYGTYQTGAAVGAETGYTLPVTVPAGYYTISVKGAADYFVKGVTVTANESQTVPIHYYDLNVDPNEHTQVFRITTKEMREYVSDPAYPDYPNNFTLGLPDIDHTTDQNGETVSRIGTWHTQFGKTLMVYLYQRPDQTYDVKFTLDAQQRAALESIAEYEKNVTTRMTYTLEIESVNEDYTLNHPTVLLTADKLLAACTAENEITVGTIAWSNAYNSYEFTPAPFTIAPNFPNNP